MIKQLDQTIFNSFYFSVHASVRIPCFEYPTHSEIYFSVYDSVHNSVHNSVRSSVFNSISSHVGDSIQSYNKTEVKK